MSIILPPNLYPKLVAPDATYLYIVGTDVNGNNAALYRILKTDFVVPDSVIQMTVLDFLPNKMTVHNDVLYLTDSTPGKIWQVKLSQSPFTVELFVSGLSSPRGVDVSGTYLYTNGVEDGKGIVYKILLSDSTTVQTLANVGPDNSAGCTIIGDYLYIIVPKMPSTIVRVDLIDFSSIVDPWFTISTELNSSDCDNSIVSYNNHLYISYKLNSILLLTNFIAELDTNGTVTNSNYLPDVFTYPNFTMSWSFCQFDGIFYIAYNNQFAPHYVYPAIRMFQAPTLS